MRLAGLANRGLSLKSRRHVNSEAKCPVGYHFHINLSASILHTAVIVDSILAESASAVSLRSRLARKSDWIFSHLDENGEHVWHACKRVIDS